MNPEALQYSFDLFSKDGYSGSIEDYKNLISTDSEALDYSFSLFEKDGYGGTQEDFKVLLDTSSQGEVLEVEETNIQEPEVKESAVADTPAVEDAELVSEDVPVKEEEIVETEIKETPALQDAEIDSIKRRFDQGEFLTDQIPAYENYKQTGKTRYIFIT